MKEASGQGLYNLVKQFLLNRGILFSNIIGFANDNCAIMTKSTSGFQVKLKESVPLFFVIGCVCHSFALCANHERKCFPFWLVSFSKIVCFCFCRSSKSNHALMEI